jgi:hypothetical protein
MLEAAGPGLALGAGGGTTAAALALACTQDPSWIVRRAGLRALLRAAGRDDSAALEAAAALLDDPTLHVRIAACEAVAAVAGPGLRLPGECGKADALLAARVMGAGGDGVGGAGVRFGLLFRLGACEQHRADWSARQHAEWGHMRAWVEETLEGVRAREEVARRRAERDARYRANPIVRAVRLATQLSTDEEVLAAAQTMAARVLQGGARCWRARRRAGAARAAQEAALLGLETEERPRRRSLPGFEELLEALRLQACKMPERADVVRYVTVPRATSAVYRARFARAAPKSAGPAGR